MTMAPNKKSDPKSTTNASALSSVASMNFWSRLQQAQARSPLPDVKQIETAALPLQWIIDLPPVPENNHDFYSLRICLQGSHPEIWRRVRSRSITLEALHKVVQIVMGWQDAHLHGFQIGKTRVPSKDDGVEVHEGSVQISQLFAAHLKQFTYTYDYEDNWIHTIVIEDNTSIDAEVGYPHCEAGEGASPQEDTGGIERWNELRAGLNGSRKLRSNTTELLKMRIGHTRISKNLNFEEINQLLKSEFH